MALSRTDSGLAVEYLFRPKIVVYVEGLTDIPFYEEMLQNYNCEVTPGNGKAECEKLATALLQDDDPYVVVLDGDYEILESTRSKHRRVILLHRYSVENYLFEEEPIQQFCRDYAQELVNRFREFVNIIEQKLKELIVLDVARRCSKVSYEVLPSSPEAFFEQEPPRTINFRDDEIHRRCTEATDLIDEQSIEDAENLVDEFLKEYRLIDLLPGHFALGIIRRLIINTVNENVSNREIRVYLSRVVWGLVKTRDHNSLKRRLRRAVREAQKMPRPGQAIQRS